MHALECIRVRHQLAVGLVAGHLEVDEGTRHAFLERNAEACDDRLARIAGNVRGGVRSAGVLRHHVHLRQRFDGRLDGILERRGQRHGQAIEVPREKQLAHNEAHGITPKSVKKAVADVMEGARSSSDTGPRAFARVAEELSEYGRMSAQELNKEIKQLEEQMYRHARDLEFEEAAAIRDRVRRIREGNLGV